MVSRKLYDFVSRQVNAAASQETTAENLQPPALDKQAEPALICSPPSSGTTDETLEDKIINKGLNWKKKSSENQSKVK